MNEKLKRQSTASHEQLVRDWLSEFKSLPKPSRSSYAAKIKNRNHLIKSFHFCFVSLNDPNLSCLIQPICHQLFEFYKSGFKELNLFALAAFPSIIEAYFKICISTKDLNDIGFSLETLLLSVHNLICATMDKDQQPSLFSSNGIDIPSIIHSSAFHDSMAYPFSERTLSMPKHSSSSVRAKLPTPSVYSSMVPSNRNKIIFTIMLRYLDQLALIPSSSLLHLCDLCLCLGSYGFPWQAMFFKGDRTQHRRINVAPDLCLVIIRCVYYAIYNDHRVEASKAVQSMLRRARYEMWPKVLLLCNAILNSVFHEKAGSNKDSPLGISIASTPLSSRSSTRHAATAKSIKYHRWSHSNEEISGDFTESLLQENLHLLETIPSVVALEVEDSNKVEKSSLSPAKILKSKMKKNTPFPSTNSPGEKPRSLIVEKKGKKSVPVSSEENMHLEGRTRSPSGGQILDYSFSKANKNSSSSILSRRKFSLEESKGSADRNDLSTKNDFDISLKVSKEQLTNKSTDITSTTSSKKSKFDKKNRSKSSKESDSRDSVKSTKSKTESQFRSESVPLLESRLNGDDANSTSLTTQL